MQKDVVIADLHSFGFPKFIVSEGFNSHQEDYFRVWEEWGIPPFPIFALSFSNDS